MIENPALPYIEDDLDFLKSDPSSRQLSLDTVSYDPTAQPPVHTIVSGMLRVGAAAVILSMITGMMEAGAVVAVIGAARLYYSISGFN